MIQPVKNMTPAERKAWNEWLVTCKRIKEGTPAIPKETGVQQEERKAYLLRPENFEEWVEWYFKSPDFDPAPLAWFHKEAIQNVLEKKLRKHLWELFRESAKSVVGDIFLPIHMLMDGELTGMILASETDDKAKNLIKDVEAQLRSNPRIIYDYGDFGITGSWLQSFFQTKDGIGFWSFGLNQNPAGVRNAFRRPNLGIVDDADSFLKAKNEKLTRQKVDWIKGEFMGCLAKDNRYFIYLNNRVHRAGITARLVGDVNEGDPVDTSFAHIKAYLTEDPETHEPIYPEGHSEAEVLQSLIEQGAAPAWKEYYSLDDCAHKIWDYGLRNAKRQLYHLHVDEGGLFTDENLLWTEPLPLNAYDALVIYCDPAFGESGKGCYKGIALVGKKGHAYHILWVWLRTMGNWVNVHRMKSEEIRNSGQLTKSENKSVALKTPFRDWVEGNSLQRTELRKTYKLESLNHDTYWAPRFDEDKKDNKISRIETMEPLANAKLLLFNAQLRSDRDMIKLREQYKEFPDGYSDGPDCVHGAIVKLDQMVRTVKVPPRTGKFKKDKKKIG